MGELYNAGGCRTPRGPLMRQLLRLIALVWANACVAVGSGRSSHLPVCRLAADSVTLAPVEHAEEAEHPPALHVS